jgi:hypothetical protein
MSHPLLSDISQIQLQPLGDVMMLIIPILLLLIRASIFHLELEKNVGALKTITFCTFF